MTNSRLVLSENVANQNQNSCFYMIFKACFMFFILIDPVEIGQESTVERGRRAVKDCGLEQKAGVPED